MKRPRPVRDVARRDSKTIVASASSQPGTRAASNLPTSGRDDSKWAWHQQVLLALRERLLAERQARLTEAAQPLEPHSLDPADSASDEFDHNVALAMLSAEQDALHEIDAALHRIRTGTYGRCEATRKPISAARLRAVPWTRFAHSTAMQQEAAGGISLPHLGALGTIRSLRTASRLSDAVGAEADTEVTSAGIEAIAQPGPEPSDDFSAGELKPETQATQQRR